MKTDSSLPHLKNQDNGLYELPFPSYLTALQESDQQVVWSKNKFKEGAILLYLQNVDLTKEILRDSSAVACTSPSLLGAIAADRASFLVLATPTSQYSKIWNQAREEFEKTGKIKGSLFLTPCFQKSWLSHYDIEYLKKVQ